MAAATAFFPVSSATRSRVLETAGAVLLKTFSDCSHRYQGLEQHQGDDHIRQRQVDLYVRASPQIHEPQSSCYTCHRRCGAHHPTSSSRGSKLLIQLRDLLDIDFVTTVGSPVVPTVGAGANTLASETTRHHRASDQRQDGLSGRYSAHKLSRDCLVTTWLFVSTAV